MGRTPPKLGADPHSGCLRRRPQRGAARIHGTRSQFAASLAPSSALRHIPVHSDLLKPPEDAAAEARMLLPVTPRPQQPVRPARSVRMPPFHPHADLERRCAGGLAGSAAPPACR